MTVKQYSFSSVAEIDGHSGFSADLVLGFGSKALLADSALYPALQAAYPKAIIGLASSAGEIFNTEVMDQTLSVVALAFDHTRLQWRNVDVGDDTDSFTAGADLIRDLPADELQHVLILSDGSLVNGSELVKGMRSVLPDRIPVTGGLAGDGSDFGYTLVGINEIPRQGRIGAIGFYGTHLRVSHGSCGGWSPFGLEKTVTKATGNELLEINGRNALAMYKEYLGKHAADLPGSALLFPLSIRLEGEEDYLVRTILSVDNERSTMTFAGDLPVGSKVRFMRANTDKLVDAASTAASAALSPFDTGRPAIAFLVSCVGRKLVLGERVDEEVEAVAEVLGPDTILTGYYSYGELAPVRAGGSCELHNQTMTITCLQEEGEQPNATA